MMIEMLHINLLIEIVTTCQPRAVSEKKIGSDGGRGVILTML